MIPIMVYEERQGRQCEKLCKELALGTLDSVKRSAVNS